MQHSDKSDMFVHRRLGKRKIADTLEWWSQELELDEFTEGRKIQGASARKTLATIGDHYFGYRP